MFHSQYTSYPFLFSYDILEQNISFQLRDAVTFVLICTVLVVFKPHKTESKITKNTTLGPEKVFCTCHNGTALFFFHTHSFF